MNSARLSGPLSAISRRKWSLASLTLGARALRLPHQPSAAEDERRREELPFRQAEGEIAHERVRRAEALADDPGDAVADEKGAGEEARTLAQPRPPQEEKHEEEHGPFEERLVDLARMTGLRPPARKDHAPGQIGGTAEQLAIHEIGQAAEEEADRHGAADGVADHEEREAIAPAEEEQRQHDAEQAPVERHAAMPEGEDLAGMGEIIARLIEEHIADASPEDDAEGAPEHEVVHLRRGHGLGRRRRDPPHMPPAEENAGDIGERVPADRKRPDAEGNRIEIGEMQSHGRARRVAVRDRDRERREYSSRNGGH